MVERFRRLVLLLVGVSFIPWLPSSLGDDRLHIPFGKPIDTDGKISPGEWEDANSVEIRIRKDWLVRVGAKHDFKNIYFVFEGVKHGEEHLFPEILIDPQNRKTTTWENGQWWLHVSNNLCEGNGQPNMYEKSGVFQCSHTKDGWGGNNPPEKQTDVVEIRVAFAKLGIIPVSGKPLGIGFDVTDATGNEKQRWYLWPAKAHLMSPRSWGDAFIE
jgi:hypothetical protein